MANISGHVYYDQTNLLTPGIGIANVPVALYDPVGLLGAVALTDSAGAFTFTNVPNGNYQVIEAWGTAGGLPTPVNYTASAVPTPSAPTEQEPPLSAISVVPPAMADKLQALTPNQLNITVIGPDITNLVFFDGPVGDKPLILTGVNMVGPNLITAADNGTFGSNPPGTPGNTIPPVAPYPGVTPGFTYSTNQTPPDGFYTIYNTASDLAVPTSVYWATSDHTTGLETGRLQYINGDTPGAAMFQQIVNVTPNTNYVVSTWVMNAINQPVGFADPALGLRVLDANGNVLVTQAVNPIPAQQLPVWFQNGFLFNSGANSSLTVQVISLGAAATGNDYRIDDVAMFEAQFVDLLTQQKTITPATVYSQTGVGETVTLTVNVTNPTTMTINNVAFLDTLDPRLSFTAGSLTINGNPTAFDPNTGFSLGNMAPGAVLTVQFQATTIGGPYTSSFTIPNTAQISYDVITSGTGDVVRGTFPTNTAQVQIVLNNAALTIDKLTDKSFAQPGDVLTYTLNLTNTGTVSANNVILTDAVPAGTTFVSGSLTGATGTPPTLTLAAPIAAGGSAVVTFKVTVNPGIPAPNPIPNSATAAFTFTVDPANPNGASGTAASNTVNTQVNFASVAAGKTVDNAYAQPGDVLTYTINLTNSGNAAANNVLLTDVIPAGTTYVAGSLTGATGTFPALTLNAPIPAGGSAVVTFQVLVGATVPNLNPVVNTVSAAYSYTVDPANPDGAVGVAQSGPAATQINTAVVTTAKTVDKAYAIPGDVLTYTLTLTNSGNVPANNVVLTDAVPAGTTFLAGSVTGATGTPPTLTLLAPIAPGGNAVVTFQVTVNAGIPTPNPIPNSASTAFTYTVNPAEPDGVRGTSDSNIVTTQVTFADVTTVKTVTPAYAEPGDVLDYTITLQNNGNAAANNVVITDTLPTGATYVAGSLTGATGTFPSLTLNAPIAAGGTATVTYQLKLGNSIPTPNPLENTASAAYTYTSDPAQPNGKSATSTASTANAQVNTAKLAIAKTADKKISYIGNVITYTLAITNSGNVNADNVVINDAIPVGTALVPGSLTANVPFTGSLPAITLTNPVTPGDVVTVSFKLTVTDIPIPNPIVNTATATYAYTVDPAAPDAVTATATSNAVSTIVFRYDYKQQISDLIESVALEQAALAAIANAEGAKVQAAVAMGNITQQELLCINKSVADMLDSLALLEAVLKQKLNIVDCQIDGSVC